MLGCFKSVISENTFLQFLIQMHKQVNQDVVSLQLKVLYFYITNMLIYTLITDN